MICCTLIGLTLAPDCVLRVLKTRQTGEEVGRQVCVKGEEDKADRRRGGKTTVC